MKISNILLSASAMLFAFVGVTPVTSAQTNPTQEVLAIADPVKTEISESQLPRAVKEAIKNSQYSDWTVSKVYQITDTEDDSKLEFEVHFKNTEDENEIVIYDKAGKIVND